MISLKNTLETSKNLHAVPDHEFAVCWKERVRFFIEECEAPVCSNEEKAVLKELLSRWEHDYAACVQAQMAWSEAAAQCEKSRRAVERLAVQENRGPNPPMRLPFLRRTA